METEFEGVIELHVLMHSLTGPTLLFPASKSDLKHWRELKGGADTKGGTETELGGRECLVLMYSLTGPILLLSASKSDYKHNISASSNFLFTG